MGRQKERERGARPPVCQYCAAIALFDRDALGFGTVN